MHCIDQKWQFILLQKIFYFLNAGYLSFVFYKRILETMHHYFHKHIEQHNCFQHQKY